MADPPRCKSCLWWKTFDGVKGECHEQSPSPQVRGPYCSDHLLQVFWPPVNADCFCGRHQPYPVRQVVSPDLRHKEPAGENATEQSREGDSTTGLDQAIGRAFNG
jgi:hypothetical protein